MSKVKWWMVGAIAMVFLGWVYASPYIAVYQMRKAAEAKDAVGISDHVNFQALRESLKGNFSAKMGKELAKEKDNPFAAVGAAIAGSLVNSLVDAMVTPEAISAMMEGQKPNARTILSDPKSEAGEKDKPDVAMGYEKLNRFVLKVRSKEPGGEEIGMVFQRDGMTWKLTAIRLPI